MPSSLQYPLERHREVQRFRSRHAHLLAAHLNAGRARSPALVHAGGSVPHHHHHGFERHVSGAISSTIRWAENRVR
jgi:hypothetical protein